MEGRTIGRGAAPSAVGESFRVFLKDGPVLGRLTIDAVGNGSVTFTVPDLTSGSYEVLIDCPPCAPYSNGRDILPVGELRVGGGPPALSDMRAPGVNGWAVATGAAFLCAVVASFQRFKRTA